MKLATKDRPKNHGHHRPAGGIFWDIKNPDNLSKAAMLERTLNYSDWPETLRILKRLGIRKSAAIFRKQMEGRNNYRPVIANYFKLYFRKHA